MTFSAFNKVNKVFETNHLMKGLVCRLWYVFILIVLFDYQTSLTVLYMQFFPPLLCLG